MLLKCGPENTNWEGVESKTEFILTTLDISTAVRTDVNQLSFC